MKVRLKLLFVSAVTGLCAQLPVPAAVNAIAFQQGQDVMMSYSGTLQLADLTQSGAYVNGGLHGVVGAFYIGPGPGVPMAPFFDGTYPVDAYTGQTIEGPLTFITTTDFIDADAGTGSLFGIIGGGDDGNGVPLTSPGIYVPENYVNNTQISGTATFSNTTLAALGLIEGVYTWEWGFNNPDSATLTVVPEPATNVLLLLGGSAVCLGLSILRRRAKT